MLIILLPMNRHFKHISHNLLAASPLTSWVSKCKLGVVVCKNSLKPSQDIK